MKKYEFNAKIIITSIEEKDLSKEEQGRLALQVEIALNSMCYVPVPKNIGILHSFPNEVNIPFRIHLKE